MIRDIPTKQDFYFSADDMVNEAWEKISNLAHEYYKIEQSNEFYISSEHFGIAYVSSVEEYWSHNRPKLISALTLVLQSVEFRLKGLVCEISPYLLLSNPSKNIPSRNNDISFLDFRTIDAQDLIKLYETFSNKKLDNSFKNWYEQSRILRNRFMHAVDKASEITPEYIFKSIVTAHEGLKDNDLSWVKSRYKYKASMSNGGVKFNDENFSGEVFEMLQVHYELTGAIHCCNLETADQIFNFNKSQEAFYCRKCVGVMAQYEYFDSKHIDYCVGTVQENKNTSLFKCIFCNEEYADYNGELWSD